MRGTLINREPLLLELVKAVSFRHPKKCQYDMFFLWRHGYFNIDEWNFRFQCLCVTVFKFSFTLFSFIDDDCRLLRCAVLCSGKNACLPLNRNFPRKWRLEASLRSYWNRIQTVYDMRCLVFLFRFSVNALKPFCLLVTSDVMSSWILMNFS